MPRKYTNSSTKTSYGQFGCKNAKKIKGENLSKIRVDSYENKICCMCKKNIICKCINEQGIKIKYRTCFTINGFPKATLDNKMHEIHLCSRNCENLFIKSKDSRQYQDKKNGMETIKIGNYTMTYDPKQISKDDAYIDLTNQLGIKIFQHGTYYDEEGDPFDSENEANWDGDQQIGFRSPKI
jgi:hypothetical protein